MFLGIEKFDKNKIAAIDDKGERITYGELAEYTLPIAEIIPKRSVVFLMCRNTVGCIVSYISMIENDIVPVMLNENIDRELYESLVETYQPQFVSVDKSLEKKFHYSPVFECQNFVYLATGYPEYPINEKLELLMTTSGSTGSPKLVRYKKGNLESNARNVAKAWGWTNSERPVCDLLMNYTMGLNVINTHLYVGATLLLVTSNITDIKYWNFIKNERATNYTGVPFSYDLLWKLRFYKMDLPYLTTLSSGGGKLTDQMFISIAEYALENRKRFIASFGTTETSARMAMLDANMAIDKVGSIGKAIPEGELFLLDDDGKLIEKTEAEGELGYTGPNVTMGYSLTKEDLILDDVFNGMYRTGDVARRDKDGYYYIIGRKNRFLKMLGYRVNLDQCEQLIRNKFNIDCACIGTDAQMTIFITVTDSSDMVKKYLSEKTGIYLSMFRVIVIDTIPRNSSGKILFKKLERKL